MSFIVPERPAAVSGSPESLFRDLTRAPDGPQHLWAHQADLLRDYEKHVNAPDLAIELPTGAGKTLVGMLIAEWRRRRSERVVYLCPTKQLARQAAADAARAGIRTVDLTGPAPKWDIGNEMAYQRCEAIAVAAYQSVFNSSPRLADAQLLVLDDAHAAAGPVLSAWTVELDRDDLGYQQVLTLCAEGLDAAVAARLAQGSEDPRDRRAGYLIDPRVVAAHLEQVHTAIATSVAGTDKRYAWSMIRDSLPACSFFIAVDQLQIRPIIAPTAGHSAFDDPRQRIYLSATLGDGGELERAFGRANITRLQIPKGWDERGTGRRFFLFPELATDFSQGADDSGSGELDAFIRNTILDAKRALLLAPSHKALEDLTGRYIPPGVPVVTAAQINDSLDAFTSPESAVLALANRYDGIDLPDNACRLIVMAGLPIGADPHERFLAFTLGAKRVLQERMRTRLVQGSGRATRNANDWAAVIVLGHDLVSFAGMKDAQAATHPEVRAELEFGIANSQGQPASKLTENLAHFLAQDQTWRELAEPGIAGLRDRPTDTGRADASALTASARYEIRAVQAAWRGDWAHAAHAAERAIDALAGGAELRPYQAFWNYLGGYWASQVASTTADQTYSLLASKLTAAAYSAASRTTWIPRRGAASSSASVEAAVTAVDRIAAEQLVSLARQLGTGRAVMALLDSVKEDLRTQSPALYERGLVSLGKLVGATSAKPDGDARADALWRWDDELWIAWEAKSAQAHDRPVDAASVRQANTHLRASARDLDSTVPPGSITVLSTPRTVIDRSVLPLAEEHLVLASLDVVQELSDDVVAAWQELRGRLLSDADDGAKVFAIVQAFAEHDVLPSMLPARLSGRLI